MKRRGIYFGLVGIAIFAAVVISARPSVLVSQRLKVRKSTVILRIVEDEGNLYAEAYEFKIWSHGWKARNWIGDAIIIGRDNPRILAVNNGQLFQMSVGKGQVMFNPMVRGLSAPRIME